MKETKYRVWDKKGSRWINTNVIIDAYGILIWSFAFEIRPIDDPENYDVEYFTGFKDEAGKEIYQGDILSGDYPDEVFWDNDRGQWMLRNSENPDDTLWEIMRDNNPKIIGNIMENPEILEEGNIGRRPIKKGNEAK